MTSNAPAAALSLGATASPTAVGTPAKPRATLQRRWLPVATIFFVTVAAYLPILHARFIWDDDQHVTNNKLLKTVDGLRTLWLDRTALPQYYPLTHTFFWVEYRLWGVHAFGYHAVNLLLHVCNATFIWLILRRLAVPGALLAALLFAVHPINVETVGWISERKNTLSTFFYLLSFQAYYCFEQRSRSREWWYLLALAVFICALLCKSVACTFPAAMLLILWWRDGRLRLGDVLDLMPFFVIGILLGLNTAYLERTRVTASGPEWRFASTIPGEVVARCLIAGRNVWFYLFKLLFPYPLMFEYPRWHIDISVLWQYAFPAAALAAIIALLLLRRRIGRGPATAALFFIGTLFPALGFANLYPMRFSFVADHYQYLAMVGPLTLIAAGVSSLSLRRVSEFIPAELLVALLMVLTFIRTFAFQDLASVYSDSISKNPNGWMSQTNYGVILNADGDVIDAEPHLLIGLRLHPDNAVAADQLGMIVARRNDYRVAADWFRKAIQMAPKNAGPHYNLGKVLEKLGDLDGAQREYQLAILANPNHAPARLAYAILLARHGNYLEAADELRKCLRIDPASTSARRDFVEALERSGQLDEAVRQINLLLPKLPDDAKLFNNLGLVQTARHHSAEAIAAFSHALTLDPNLTEARNHLDALLGHPLPPGSADPGSPGPR